VRERRGSYNRFCCRLYPFICWIIIKEGPGNFSGGRSPHWVNHVNLCLHCIVYLLCFVSAFVLFYCIFLFDFARNPVRNGWICRFEWLSLYNRSASVVFQHAGSIYAFRNEI
jgi:hypothetical protein